MSPQARNWAILRTAAVATIFMGDWVGGAVREPTLHRAFGESYERYCQSVQRWLPRRRTWRHWGSACTGASEGHMARDARIDLLLDIYDQAFDHRAWHGTTLWGAMRGLAHGAARWRPGSERHNIWEIALHTAYWKYIVRRRLTHDATGAFPRPGSNWPGLPMPADARAWQRDVALLKEQHRLLREVIARFPAARLGARGWRSRWTNAEHVYGIASHDLYHAGQIQLLKALRRGARGTR